MKIRLMIGAGALLLLAACGSRNALQPPKGEPLPVKPYGAETTPTADQLLTPSTQARPSRSDEVLTESKEREPDPFDLPPPN